MIAATSPTACLEMPRTTIWVSSCLTSMSRATRSWSSPFGPFTLTSSGSMAISTPSGSAIGCFPIRLIGLPHPRHQLAPDARAARVVAGHHPARGGHDGGAHPAEHLGHLVGVHVAAPPGLGHALDSADHRLAVLGVLQPHSQHLADARGLHREVLDVALLAQDAGDLRLEARGGHLHLVVVRDQAVADADEEVGDRVGLRHLPARLGQSGDVSVMGHLAQADAAEPELAQVRAWAAAPLAAVVVACLVLRSALLADDL